MFIITYRKFFYILSAVLILISIISFWKPGLNLGIDFTGGSIMQVSYGGVRPNQNTVESSISSLNLGDVEIQPIGDTGYNIRTKELSQADQTNLLNALSMGSTTGVKLDQFNSIGPVIGNELKQKAYLAIAVVVLLIVLFVTFAFRKVSEPVASWKFGLATIIALGHDVLIPSGAFIIISHFFGGQIDTLFVSAILAILGFSVHDTIVVFDRIREHLGINKRDHVQESFDQTVGKSVRETFGRSINTSLTIFIVLFFLYILGPSTTHDFTLTLIIGIITGTYSSIFIASPLLVTFEKMQEKKALKK